MRERDWTDRPLTDPMERSGLTVTPEPATQAILVSGDLAGAGAALGVEVHVGLGGEIGEGPAFLRIARDRALGVNVDHAPGWHDSFAVSAAHGLYSGLRLTGPAARHVLAQGTSLDLDQPSSPSTALRFAGETVLLTRRDGDWVIWVETPRLTPLSSWLRGADLTI